MVIMILIAVGCTKDLVVDSMTEPIEEKIEAIINDSQTNYLVTELQAIEIANAFFDIQANTSGLRSSIAKTDSKSLVEVIKEERSNDPLMYVINYSEGGWAIVSATKSYYPVLAYSDENSFIQTSDIADMGPAGIWLSETKDAIKASETLDDSTRMVISSMWNNYTMEYEPDQIVSNLRSSNPMQDALSRRISELVSRYGAGSSYRITTLAGARNLLSSISEWQSLCNWANSQGSPPEYTIFVGKNVYSTPTVGPLLPTRWHQGSPFNNLMPLSRDAGCAAIAVAQVMRYYQYPSSFYWNGSTFNWSNIPVNPDSGSKQAALIKLVGEDLNMNYTTFGSWATPGNVESGIRSMGYTVTRANHNYNLVRTQLLTYRKPVIMLGGSLDAFDPITYLGDSHYWVCDGAKEYDHNLVYFMDLINTSNNTYYNHPYVYSPSNPFSTDITYVLNFHMNWGWGGKYDGWFLNHNANPGDHNYKYGRKDYYITRP